MAKEYTFDVKGMHCASCVLLIERELKQVEGVETVHADLSHEIVRVRGEFGDASKEMIAEKFTGILASSGYSVGGNTEKKQVTQNEDLRIAVMIALAILLLFLGFQRSGVMNLISINHISLGSAFLIGIIASLSTCMAMVGGLLLSLSATFAKSGERTSSQVLFHAGRFVSFFLLGGLVGAAGASFQLNATWMFVLNLLVGIVMLLLGLNLLELFSWTKTAMIRMPKFLANKALDASSLRSGLAPLMTGIVTFFLPCGFTQAMQFYALSTGSFWTGAFTMSAFALGTFPVLAFIGFSSFSFGKGRTANIFFKTVGLVVIAFALFNILNGLVVANIIPPFLNL